ncbi:MAG: polyprenyl diphosphate synthase [Planctomycetota bacterium]|nr:polyprenyl diphosphate synthase [Planctomycetota bacterium]
MSNQQEAHPPLSADEPSVAAALARIHSYNDKAIPLTRLPDVHPARIPAHVAIIMDGNGRWATSRGFPRQFGHVNGAASVRGVVEECVRLGIRCLTRPADEIAALMQLCQTYIDGEEQEMMRQGIRFRVIGRREGLPDEVLSTIDRVTAATAGNSRCTLCLAINYGGRAELVDAARTVAREVAAGKLGPESIDEAVFAERLTTAGMPDPDLLIRTAGEMRISNFLLWQISYSEIHVTQTLWPDFGIGELHEAIRAYSRRSRRFGGIQEAIVNA